MKQSIQIISLLDLVIIFIPVLITILIFFKWSLSSKNALYAIFRMLVQLLLVGYFLAYIFNTKNSYLILSILISMVFTSSWIALGTVKKHRKALCQYAILSISIGGGSSLLCVTQGVLHLEPWYLPQYVIPLAGMIFANSMNSVSLAGERLIAEIERGIPYDEARSIALQAATIPLINSLFAVGIVSIPGMMTGQILSGVSPLIAARYQIMVMCMVFGAGGISAACFLTTARNYFKNQNL